MKICGYLYFTYTLFYVTLMMRIYFLEITRTNVPVAGSHRNPPESDKSKITPVICQS